MEDIAEIHISLMLFIMSSRKIKFRIIAKEVIQGMKKDLHSVITIKLYFEICHIKFEDGENKVLGQTFFPPFNKFYLNVYIS